MYNIIRYEFNVQKHYMFHSNGEYFRAHDKTLQAEHSTYYCVMKINDSDRSKENEIEKRERLA